MYNSDFVRNNQGNIPDELKQLRRWVMWTADKIPCIPQSPDEQVLTNGRPLKASSTDPATWRSFEECIAALPYGYKGIGFVLGDGYCGIDIDDSIDDSVIAKFNSYTEITPSGTGIHIIVKAAKPAGRCRIGNTEIYDSGRYFTMTGNHIKGTPQNIEDRQTEVNNFHAQLFPIEPQTVQIVNKSVSHHDNVIIERLNNATNNAKFKKLYAGDYKDDYKSQSEADLALCSLIAFWTQCTDQIDRIFKLSKLYRGKWDREDYKHTTLEQALKIDAYFDWTVAPYNDPINEIIKEVDTTVKPDLPFNYVKGLLNWTEFTQLYGNNTTEYIIDELLPAAGLTIISGAPYSGKTNLVDYMISCMVNGEEFLRFATHARPILHFDYDFQQSRRVKRLAKMTNLTNLHNLFYSFDDKDQPTKLEASFLDRLIKQPSLILIDTMRASLYEGMEAGGENDGTIMVQALKPFREVAVHTHSAIVFLHHNNKSHDDIAGSFTIKGTTEATWNYKRPEESCIATLHVQTRDKLLKPISVEMENGEFVIRDPKAKIDEFVQRLPLNKPMTTKEMEQLTSTSGGTTPRRLEAAIANGDIVTSDGRGKTNKHITLYTRIK